jgi:hemerythrin-like domain-containing protein
MRSNRREVLAGLVTVAGLGLVACEKREAEVTPGEDLMQEHGLLERVLLIYDEAVARIERNQELDTTVIVRSAQLVQRFIEGYHEKSEEKSVFPRLQKARLEVELVGTLLRQHEAGRTITSSILSMATRQASPELGGAMREFVRMYRPHAAREETVLFPAFRSLVGRHGYHELGEQFEDEEHRLFGEHGFEDAVKEVTKLEAAIGIAQLDAFTPA